MPSDTPLVTLIVLDGFGLRMEREWNAIAHAQTPVFDRLFAEEPWTGLAASGLRVGLPEGQMGNSEVGHLNMGAGRVVDQDIVRITKAALGGELSSNAALTDTFDKLRRTGGSLHLVGLVSDGGVHSLQVHLHALIDAAVAAGFGREGTGSIFVHAILDGRDVPPMSARIYLERLLAHIAPTPQVRLATITGRFYAMDRDRRWERTQRAWDLFTLGMGRATSDPLEMLERSYAEGVTDEFLEPVVVLGPDGAQPRAISDGDAIVFFNFRADRMRQIVCAFFDPTFEGFERTLRPQVDILTMNRYHEDYPLRMLFPPVAVRGSLGEIVAREGLKQLRIAETEKFAHVTFFFNGGTDEVWPGEERILVPSPKVSTYDKQPAMSIVELADRVIAEIDGGHFDVIILNIANPDMVGHTGVMEAAVTAVEATDTALGRILAAVERRGGVALITADHGNCETMYNPVTKQPHTAHTTNPVPLILVDSRKRYPMLRSGGALENVAPTILEILGLRTSVEMTAESLL